MRTIYFILLTFFALNINAQYYGCIIGNSTTAAGYGAQAIPTYLLSATDLSLGHRYKQLAAPGQTILQQRAAFLADGDRWYYNYVIIMIGLNDLNPATTTIYQDRNNLQSIVDTVRYFNPNCKIIICCMTPCKAERVPAWGVGAYTKWLQLNDCIMNRSDTLNNITDVDYRLEAHSLALNDGNGNLAAAYDTGDHIHENDAGRVIIANYWRVALQYFGLLPGGTLKPYVYNKEIILFSL